MATSGFVGGFATFEFERASTRFSHCQKIPECIGAGTTGGTLLTLSVQVTVPGLLKLGFHVATLLNSPFA